MEGWKDGMAADVSKVSYVLSFCAAAVIVANLTSDQVVPAFNGQPGSAEAMFDFFTLTNSSSYVEFGFKDLGNVSGMSHHESPNRNR